MWIFISIKYLELFIFNQFFQLKFQFLPCFHSMISVKNDVHYYFFAFYLFSMLDLFCLYRMITVIYYQYCLEFSEVYQQNFQFLLMCLLSGLYLKIHFQIFIVCNHSLFHLFLSLFSKVQSRMSKQSNMSVYSHISAYCYMYVYCYHDAFHLSNHLFENCFNLLVLHGLKPNSL